MLTDKHYETIMDCLDEFDFGKVHKVMMHLNWTYADCKDVPTVEYLRKQTRGYLIRVATEALERKTTYITSTGGFRYEAKLYEENFLWLRMAFEIESWDNAE